MLIRIVTGSFIFLFTFFSGTFVANSVDSIIQSAFNIAGLESVVDAPKQMSVCSNSEGIWITKYQLEGREGIRISNVGAQELYYYESNIYLTNQTDTRSFVLERIKTLRPDETIVIPVPLRNKGQSYLVSFPYIPAIPMNANPRSLAARFNSSSDVPTDCF